MTKRNDIAEIKAEVLLNYLYPEMSSMWTARMEGTFYRNYNHDALTINVDEHDVILARDGFLKLLPEGLLTRDDDLKGNNKEQNMRELEHRKHLLRELFLPFDTFSFQKHIEIERIASEMLEHKLSYLLKEYFDFDIEQEESELVKKAAVMLPYVHSMRGDFGFISNMLSAIMKCEVDMTIGRYSHLDSTICWLPEIKYDLLIPDLSVEEYRQKDSELQPLRDFIKEWLIPFDVVCRIHIKDHPNEQPKQYTLGYNTELRSEKR